jgi:hypothetical protein
MAKTIITNDGQRDDSAQPADLEERHRLAFEAAAQIDAMAGVIGREIEGRNSEFENFLIGPMLERIKKLACVVVSIHGGDDLRKTEEMREVLRG